MDKKQQTNWPAILSFACLSTDALANLSEHAEALAALWHKVLPDLNSEELEGLKSQWFLEMLHFGTLEHRVREIESRVQSKFKGSEEQTNQTLKFFVDEMLQWGGVHYKDCVLQFCRMRDALVLLKGKATNHKRKPTPTVDPLEREHKKMHVVDHSKVIKEILEPDLENFGRLKSMATEWSKAMDRLGLSDKRSGFLAALRVNQEWDKDPIIAKLTQVIQCDETFRLLVLQLPIPLLVKKRRSMECNKYDVCPIDEFRQRYFYVKRMLRHTTDCDLGSRLFQQEHAQWQLLREMKIYNENMEQVEKVFMAFKEEMVFQAKIDLRNVLYKEPLKEEKDNKISFPLDNMKDLYQGEFFLELAFDIARFGLEKMKRDADFYYRVRFACKM